MQRVNGQLHDADIREPLFDFLEETYGRIRIIEEKTMGRSRADVLMVIEDALVGIEIKSDADTYARLSRQVKDYDRYFDYNIVVVGSSHALHIREHVPEYWGVITVEEVDGQLDFYILRQPQRNPGMKLEKKLKILWRPELAKLQELNEMPKYKAESKDFVQKKIVERTKYPAEKKGYIDLALLHKQISSILMERDYNTIEEVLTAYRKENRVRPRRKKRKRTRKRVSQKSS